MTKSEFARRMGIQRQNVNVLFKTNNLETIARVAEVLEVPLALLVSYVDEPDICESRIPMPDEDAQSDICLEILPEDVPVGASLTYLSTLAVLQLDAILQNAKLEFVDKTKSGNKHQAKFEKMFA